MIISTASANRNASVFVVPGKFNADRKPNSHIAFGQGGFFCICASLARTDQWVVFGSLFRRFPGLRLAVPVEELDSRSNRPTGGVVSHSRSRAGWRP